MLSQCKWLTDWLTNSVVGWFVQMMHAVSSKIWQNSEVLSGYACRNNNHKGIDLSKCKQFSTKSPSFTD